MISFSLISAIVIADTSPFISVAFNSIAAADLLRPLCDLSVISKASAPADGAEIDLETPMLLLLMPYSSSLPFLLWGGVFGLFDDSLSTASCFFVFGKDSMLGSSSCSLEYAASMTFSTTNFRRSLWLSLARLSRFDDSSAVPVNLAETSDSGFEDGSDMPEPFVVG